MAQPQGLNVPAIITVGIVGVILTAAVVEGVRAYFNYEYALETARKYDSASSTSRDRLREEQIRAIRFDTTLPIDAAMSKLVSTGGKLPTTQPMTPSTTQPTIQPVK